MVDRAVGSEELVAAFGRLRELWKGLYDELPPEAEREGLEAGVGDDLRAVQAGGRLSEEARPFVELAYVVRMDEWRAAARALCDELCDEPSDEPSDERPGEEPREARREHPRERPRDLEEAAAGVRSGFEMRLRTLRQMESGDEILPDSGREIRRSSARDLVFFSGLMKLPPRKDEGGDAAPRRLAQSFDPRRKLVREEIEVPNSAIEAIEFLVRLGAG